VNAVCVFCGSSPGARPSYRAAAERLAEAIAARGLDLVYGGASVGLMGARADAFIALPGGIGTLEEWFEVLTWSQLGFHAKPCALLDADGYFAPLLAFLDRAVAERFVTPAHRAMMLVDEDPARLLDALAAWRAPVVEKWIDRSET
jgi:predicted Rossmann-fold nucleotide-binding protein